MKRLELASAAYYMGEPIMTDAEFDKVVSELRRNDPGNPFLKRIGAPVPGTLKVKHDIPMGSLSNANNGDEFGAWIPEDNPQINLSHKLDGSSLELVYEDGSFVQAITRGDGKFGEDITRNASKSGNIPLSIHPSITSVRCECLIWKEDWKKHFKGDANPRNSAAGTLRRHDGHNAQYLRFYAFDALVDIGKTSYEILMCLESENGVLSILQDWFLIPDYISLSDLNRLIGWCREAEINRDEFAYEIDGVVAKIDDRANSKRMGIRDGRPKGQIAIKFKPRGGETVLRNVIWQVGHTGALTPIGEVDPIGVGGTMIERVTLCNPDEIERLGICIGDTVEVVRAGDVIPKLSKLIRAGTKSKIIRPPKKCPECGSKTIRDRARLYCQNDECPGVSFGRVMTWIKKRNILNVGEGVVRAAEISRIEELYSFLTLMRQWANLEVGNGILGEKRAKKVMEALEKSRSVSLPEFLGSIGIKGVGRSLCRILCEGLGLKAIDDVFSIKPEEIESLEGFGSVRANDFCNWILEHQEEIENLSSFMSFEDQPDTKSRGGVFEGEVICFTGKSPKTRSEMILLAESVGASVGSSVSSDTTILVIADTKSMSSKAVKARKMGIKLMSPEDFLAKVGV